MTDPKIHVRSLLRLLDAVNHPWSPAGEGDIVAARRFLGHQMIPCGCTEPEDPRPGRVTRTYRCEGGRLVLRGNGSDSTTDGSVFINAKFCPRCERHPRFQRTLHEDLVNAGQ